MMKALVEDAMVPGTYRIQTFKNETHDTFTLDLVPADGCGELAFAPGQFNMLYTYGTGEVPISISGDPDDSARTVHTIRAYGSVTSKMRTLKKGTVIGLRGPFGNQWPIDALTGQDILLVAGGIGVAPLRPVLYRILANRDRYGRVYLLYGERTPGDLIYRRQLEEWRGRFDLHIDATVDSARQGWRGNVGFVTDLIPKIRFDASRTTAMICGPEIMMVYTVRELMAKGFEKRQIFISMERNMKCGLGFCGHCQVGPILVCRDGPVFPYPKVEHLFRKREI
jgi:NAD(P)H-flavin reductase